MRILISFLFMLNCYIQKVSKITYKAFTSPFTSIPQKYQFCNKANPIYSYLFCSLFLVRLQISSVKSTIYILAKTFSGLSFVMNKKVEEMIVASLTISCFVEKTKNSFCVTVSGMYHILNWVVIFTIDGRSFTNSTDKIIIVFQFLYSSVEQHVLNL